MKTKNNQNLEKLEYIIIDIETTGLNLEHSSIIEVGAILIVNNAIKKSYSSLVHYEGILPEVVKRVTGITEQMLRDVSPSINVISELKDFINKRPVVSHNGFSFDFPMLERHGLKLNEKYDSMELAFFVIPTSVNGYSMPALTQRFGIGDVPHRALNDCKLEFKVIRKLQTEYTKRPKKKCEALNYLAKSIQWWWLNFLTGKAVRVDKISSLIDKCEHYRKINASQEVLEFKTTKPVNLADLDKYFISTLSSASLNDEMDYSEDRPEQRKMAALVATAFNEHKHAVIEAGTGTGKSKAYLTPSLLFALNNGIPVIISTHTKALQDQLFIKEIPHINAIVHPGLRVAMLKGKKNYVCLQKFEEFGKEVIAELSQRSLYEFGESNTKFSTRLAYLLLTSWTLETDRGDWDELPYWFKEYIPKRIEQEICNFDELCGKGTCELYEEQKCFLAKARLKAKDADLVIVNHALTLSGIRIDEEISNPENAEPIGESEKTYSHTVFPGEAKFLVFDEAHHLEDDATSAWEHIISEDILQFVFQQLYGKRGIISILMYIAKNNERLAAQFEKFSKEEDNMKSNIRTLFENILPNLVSENNNDGYNTYSIIDEIQDNYSYKKALFVILENLKIYFLNIIKIIELFAVETNDQKTRKILQVRINGIKSFIESLDIILSESKDYVRYFERSGSKVEIKATPLSVAQHLKEYVYDNFSSVILTSATLTVNKKFHFFASRCGTYFIDKQKIGYFLLKSSFDYEKQVKFFVPRGITYKGNDAHLEKSAEFLEKAILASSGGALILCSSHKQVDDLYDLLISPLSKNNIWLLRQSKGTSVSSVIRDFKKDINSVLIGTESLWQGIDVPGESLRSLFIYKIPYRMPFHPLLKARRHALDDKGKDSFQWYYEPLAALMLKQGFGRLIRKSTDRGIAVLLDEDLLNKPRLLNSLPQGINPQIAEPENIYSAFRELAKSVIMEK